ncbi:trihelix transcription factor GTL2-like [Gastrolobium bilobum]|uniref:trihelix transcription factor GTL2-like n=1 Tax=Gastrolobium bilobum TaxID=150636 RepID=UPI002AB2857A|nr:trihelix transcription factor GTL2-like [Gastrolobium bilobum]
MFDGVPDQFHQFITPRTSLPLHLPFPLHASATPSNFPTFDPYNPSHHQLPLQHNLLHPLQHHSSTHKHEEEKEENSTVSMSLEIQRDQAQLPELIDPWSNDEVLALLRIRSSMESWFPELTWEHVSRKLAELGYKRSAEKCKEKFEEESRYFNNINYNKSYRFLSELEELYQGDQNPDQVGSEKPSEGQDKNMGHHHHHHHALMEEDSSRNINIDGSVTKQNEQSGLEKTKDRSKRKRPDRFEIFKGFCESIVHTMMAQQEEMHNKLLQDMLKRDEEKFTREEAWKKQEMDKMNKELEMMAREQAIAGDRQTNIIEFLKKFSESSSASHSFGGGNGKDKNKVTKDSNTNTRIITSSPLHSQNPNNPSSAGEKSLQSTPSSTMILNQALTTTCYALSAENPSSSLAQDKSQVPSSSTSAPVPQNPSSSLNFPNNNPLETSSIANKASSNLTSTTEKDDVGRRWPKDEVLALINLRCSSLNNNNEEKEGNKAPLWERISQRMLELGYKRSAKRCKEKWENINKYFRKTKDVNRKRSLDSRTCPYFNQLSNLYNQGKLVLQSESHLNNPPANPGQVVSPDQTQAHEFSQVGSGGLSMQVDHGGEKTLMQVPSLDFDQF